MVRIAKENDVEGTRAYVVRISLRDGKMPPRIIDAAWLDRYSGRSLSRVGGTLECIGLVAAEAGEGVDAGGEVAYAAFGPAGGRRGQVTVSAVGLAPADSAGWQSRPSRVKDLDLDSNIFPSAVRWSQRTPCVELPFGAASMVGFRPLMPDAGEGEIDGFDI